ncbi:fluoride efflux transporter FluC [Phytoactinopolyspora endophytica]|uniref:fluoride efflux transporter FluC n=1 Tax=Phytoactinopolyspora endophytica TaxID=1642495 RepID=UPI00197C6FD5|nr:CrcB family protein [Phytoactinopolyspora endophytica]
MLGRALVAGPEAEPFIGWLHAGHYRGCVRAVWKRRAQVIGAIAAGGAVGAEARYALAQLDGDRSAFPWTTFVENITGCFLIGVLMAVILELTAPHRLLRPFIGVGVLGGYTTFSAYAVEVRELLADDRAAMALAYLAVTPVVALLAVWTAVRLTGTTLGRLRQRGADE